MKTDATENQQYDVKSPNISPVDFYRIIMSNKDKFTDSENLIILRFFDKLVDSKSYQLKCKESLASVHLKSKDLFKKRGILFSGSKVVKLSNLCILAPVKDTTKDGEEVLTWNLLLNGEVIIRDLTPIDAYKIVKDINTAFQILNKRNDGTNVQTKD